MLARWHFLISFRGGSRVCAGELSGRVFAAGRLGTAGAPSRCMSIQFATSRKYEYTGTVSYVLHAGVRDRCPALLPAVT
eukprot:scaffold125236_cov44-Prasinocladus_malaysianus.AAC.1